MRFALCALFAATTLATVPLHAQATESSISNQIGKLRSLSDADRPAATRKAAAEIDSLPAGLPRVKLADALVHLSTEGDPGRQTLQAVADTLASALAANPLPPGKTGNPAMPYADLAKLARYEHVTTTLADPNLTKATETLVANDAEIEKIDFTLKDLSGKKVTLSELRGKVVMVNFWATWCPPCRKEMPALDNIATHLASHNVVVLAIDDEDSFKIAKMLMGTTYHPTVLLDTGGKVAKQFHVDGIPKTFVFNAEGKLAAQSIDERTQNQFLAMLAQAGVK